jgi:hypothetical protein
MVALCAYKVLRGGQWIPDQHNLTGATLPLVLSYKTMVHIDKHFI